MYEYTVNTPTINTRIIHAYLVNTRMLNNTKKNTLNYQAIPTKEQGEKYPFKKLLCKT